MITKQDEQLFFSFLPKMLHEMQSHSRNKFLKPYNQMHYFQRLLKTLLKIFLKLHYQNYKRILILLASVMILIAILVGLSHLLFESTVHNTGQISVILAIISAKFRPAFNNSSYIWKWSAWLKL
uniref:Uncharacterized protein n=1 Tax=Rhizophagus irregularis (strain DAOM 181602 / DAOM 197198 / MUCL 43194) TaxID=747089 RepID=U9TZ28_RHIID